MTEIPTVAGSFRLALKVGLLVLAAIVVLPSGRAEAQWGYGGYGGGFWGMNNQSDQVIQGINQRAAIAAQASFASRSQSLNAITGSNSYLNSVRDPGFVDRVGISTRRGLDTRVVSSSAPTRPAPAPAPAPTPARALTLASFFSKANVLIWPADAPLSGGLDLKRSASDKATLTVYDEWKERGTASVANVAEARTLLLDYGRPALEYLRMSSTPTVADSFHQFLLGLYEALANAGTSAAPRR